MPRVLGIAHQRARILLRKTRSKILCSPKGSHFAPQNKEDYEMENETKLCKHCKSEIPKGAKVCPNCRKKQGGTITVAASATPHAEILEEAKKILADQGWDLEITIFDDYVLPNEVVESGEFDANYFQHIPYLENFNAEKGTHLVNAGGIHYEPFGIYPGTKKDLSELADGDTIAVPNDTTNEARALLLLQDNGIITLKDGAGLEATVNDIAENPHNIKIEELAAEQVARVAPEVAFVVLNGNYALLRGRRDSQAS